MNIPLTHLRFLDRAEAQFGGKTGVIDGESSWTYVEYASRCRQLANSLQKMNLSAGARVACLAYNTHHLLEAYYGVNLAGGVLVPLNIRLSPPEFEFILNDCQAEIVFFNQGLGHLLEEIQDRVDLDRQFVLLDSETPPDWAHPRCLEELLSEQSPERAVELMEIDEDSVAEIFYTSGTTGHPKGVMLTHRNLYLHGLEAALATGATDADVVLHVIPLFHVNGWGTPQYLTCLGGTHIMVHRFDVEEIFELIQKHRVTAFSLVPAMATALINHEAVADYDFSSLRMVNIGGAPSNPRLIRKMMEVFGCECCAGYGLTETTPVLTVARLKDHLQNLDEEERLELMSKAGYPVPGVQLRLVDDAGKTVPWDGEQVGEVIVRSDTVLEGYLNRPGATREAFEGGWFHTGDLATIDPNGYLQIVDRKKDIIISGGENISSVEVEKAILAHPGILECAVIPVPDPQWGEVPKALVVLKSGASVSEGDLLEYSLKRLAGFKVPKSVDFYEEFPKGGTGKILKRRLREKYWQAEVRRVH